MDNTITFDDKSKILERIKKFIPKSDENKSVMGHITKILKEDSKLDTMENKNGIFCEFNNLSYSTYSKLTKFLDKVDKLKLKKLKETVEHSENFTDEDTFTNNGSDKNMSKRLRFTNTESHVLNRVRYEKQLKQNENSSDEEIEIYDPNEHKNSQVSDIFVQVDNNKSNSKTNAKSAKSTENSQKKSRKKSGC
jgi:hypothetical protein